MLISLYVYHNIDNDSLDIIQNSNKSLVEILSN